MINIICLISTVPKMAFYYFVFSGPTHRNFNIISTNKKTYIHLKFNVIRLIMVKQTY